MTYNEINSFPTLFLSLSLLVTTIIPNGQQFLKIVAWVLFSIFSQHIYIIYSFFHNFTYYVSASGNDIYENVATTSYVKEIFETGS